MSPLFTWVDLHGASTHFPIALLILNCAFDIGAWLFRKPAWRDASLLVLVVAAIMLPVSLLSGYFLGQEFPRPPVGFDQHWKAAVITSVLTFALLLWRVLSRDKMIRHARTAALVLTLGCVATVSYTGYMGGQMVFGGAASAPETAQAAAPAVEAVAGQLDVAAGKMDTAAGKLEKATNKFADSAARAKAAPANSNPPPVAPASPSLAQVQQVAEKLERVAAKFDRVSEKLAQLADQMPATQAPRIAAAPSPAKNAPSSASKNSGKSAGKAAPPKTTPSAAPAGGLNVQLVSVGEKLFRSEDNGCLACHKLNGEGSGRGPDLTHAGRNRPDVTWHIEHLKDPAKMVPGSKMPAYDNLKPAELEALASYMASLK